MTKLNRFRKRLRGQGKRPLDGKIHRFMGTVLELVADGVIRAGKKSFDDNTAIGFWLGVDPTDGLVKFSLGGLANYLQFDGTDLKVSGDIEAAKIIGTVAIDGGEITWADGRGVADDTGISFTEDVNNVWDVGVTLDAMLVIIVDDPAKGIDVTHSKATGLAIRGYADNGGDGVQGRTTDGLGVNGLATAAGGVAVKANASGGGTSLLLAGGDADAGNQKITNLADATANQDALNRQTGDARYLQQSSGWSGTFTNGDGDIVTVVNGQITDVS